MMGMKKYGIDGMNGMTLMEKTRKMTKNHKMTIITR